MTIDPTFLSKLLEKLYPIKDDATPLMISRAETARDTFMQAYNAPDISKFSGTAWGVINAASDIAGHATPVRNTATFQERRWDKIMDGHPILETVVSAVNNLMVHA